MAAAFRRVSLLAFLFAFIALAGSAAGQSPAALLVHALEPETFDETRPPKLYEGDFSHGDPIANPASADTTDVLNGYCVTVEHNNVSADTSAGAHGFTAEGGTVVSTDAFDSGPQTSVGDTYCATVQAGILERPDMDGEMTLSWHYTDGDVTDAVDLTIDIFRIELESLDGFVNGAGEICTVNWDPAVLTGRASLLPGDLPNPIDDVRLGANPPADIATDQLDWQIGPGGATFDKLGQFRKDAEWCLSLNADAPVSDLDVTLQFDAVYDRDSLLDDSDHSETTELDFTVPGFAQLQHVSPAGLLMASPVSNVNVIGSRHSVCIIPSTRDDSLGSQGVSISPGNVIGFTTFYNDRDTILGGVPDDTLCFRWTSTDAGSQLVQANYTYRAGEADEEDRYAGWDTDGNGNGQEDLAGSPLVVRWGVIDRTEITRGTDPDRDIVTNSRFETPVALNFADGNWGSAPIPFTEWVHGFTGPDEDVPALLDGVILEANITSACGYFLTDDPVDVNRKTIEGVSAAGRLDHTGDGLPDDLLVTITNDADCTINSVMRIEIDAYYPDPVSSARGELFDTEWVEITFTRSPTVKTPRLAWVGQTVQTTFAFGGNCDAFDGETIQFVASQEGGSGTFLPGPGVNLSGARGASGIFRSSEQPGHGACSFTVGYEAEDPGEVDIEVFFEGKPWTRTSHPIFYMVLEDVTLSSTDDLHLSGNGSVNAFVRGWFPGSNPSGRTATTHEHDRVTPADRWVLPDDWEQLRGDAEDRPNWPTSAPMPPLRVTFHMEDEGVVNQYPDGPTEGSAGWFLLGDNQFMLNENPRSGRESALGSTLRPRIISTFNGPNGAAAVGTAGDLNLSYRDCPINAPTGNPHCGIDDIVGTGKYYAVADYPESRNLGKHPPVYSNTSETDWRWDGYKDISIVDTDSPTIKYVVLHLRDRHGRCDAIDRHNVLGIGADFQVDGGSGRIIDVAGRPSSIAVNGRGATVTTFDILDDIGEPMNEDIARATRFGDSDECQAWIKVSNSLLTSTSVLVTIPGQPAPIPGDLEITDLQCSLDESVTITNTGDTPVSLAGFGLRSYRQSITDPEQHLGLDGYLEPGESATFPGGPDADEHGWLLASQGRIFNDRANDYARLVWNEFEIHRLSCDGSERRPELPSPLPADGEGELQLNVVVPFGEDETELQLAEGWNLFTMSGSSRSVENALGDNYDDVTAVYRYDSQTRSWERHFRDAPAYASTLDDLQEGSVYWVLVKRSFTLNLE